MSRNKSNRLVRVLDMDVLNKTVLEYLISKGMEFEDNTRIKPQFELGIATAKKR